MIFQNISKAVREQNWFAVAIEFLIVILGVVIGFQIQAWNEGRQADARASILFDRLLDEVSIALDGHQRDLEWLVERHHAFAQFNSVLAPGAEMDGSEALCGLLDQSHIYIWSGVRIPVLAEITATGSLDLFADSRVRAAVTALDADLAGIRDRIEIIRSVETVVRLQFPRLLRVVPAEPGEVRPNEWAVECDWAGMRADPALFNVVANNYDRQGALLNIYRFEIAAMRRLLEVVEAPGARP